MGQIVEIRKFRKFHFDIDAANSLHSDLLPQLPSQSPHHDRLAASHLLQLNHIHLSIALSSTTLENHTLNRFPLLLTIHPRIFLRCRLLR